ncbi:unnamed protein product [Mytilus edulis]|uniref:Uncharacterized protein n=1 Tax=Mytilus edulis TaxID=6550 RepID=A0A8S3S2W0_MYTED|nr:unnamed protein product [Mytilus edulis]
MVIISDSKVDTGLTGTFVLVTIIVVILHTTKGFILQNLPTTGFEATKHSQTTASTKLESSHNSAGVSGPNFHHSASQSSKHTLDTLVLDLDNFIQSIKNGDVTLTENIKQLPNIPSFDSLRYREQTEDDFFVFLRYFNAIKHSGVERNIVASLKQAICSMRADNLITTANDWCRPGFMRIPDNVPTVTKIPTQKASIYLAEVSVILTDLKIYITELYAKISKM